MCLLSQNAKTTKILGLNFLYKYFSTQNIHLQICFQFQFIFALFFFLPNSFLQSNSNNTFFFDSMFFYGTILFSYSRNVFFVRPIFFCCFFSYPFFFVCSGSRELNKVSSSLVVHWKKRKQIELAYECLLLFNQPR